MKVCVILLFAVAGILLSAEEPVRTWTDLDGKTIQASFIKFKGKDIVIRRADGKLFQVHPSYFSTQDRKYLFEMSVLIRSKQPVHFKDDQLETLIRKSLNKAEGDLTRADMAKLLDLTTPPGSRIADLSGIEHAVNLNKLSLGYNKITDVKPLVGLDKLKRLDLKYNHLTDAVLLGNMEGLQYLVLHGNRIKSDQKKLLERALPNCKIKFTPQFAP